MPGESRLADAGLPNDRQKPRSPDRDRPTILLEQTVELSFPPDEHRSQVSEAASALTVELADQAAIDNAASSLRVDRFGIGELECVDRCRRRPLANNDFPRCSGLLEPRGDVHSIAGDKGTPLAAAADNHLAAVDADPQDELVTEQLVQFAPHRHPRTQRALSIVLVCDRCAERSHDGIAHELLNGAARRFDLRTHCYVEAIEHRSRPFGILGGAELRRSDQVGEKDGRDLPLLRRQFRRRASRAMRTEPSLFGNRTSTLRTSGHGHEFDPERPRSTRLAFAHRRRCRLCRRRRYSRNRNESRSKSPLSRATRGRTSSGDGAYRDRTGDLRLAKPALSQLS